MRLLFSALAALAVSSVAAAPGISTKTSSSSATKSVVAEATVPTSHSNSKAHGKSPCAIVSSKAAAAIAANPDVTTALIPVEDGINCLRSVPINKTDALNLVASLAPYLEFQSTLDFLKNPPPGYLLPSVDLIGGLEDIASKLEEGAYLNEYDFQIEINALFRSAHDGHLSFKGDAVGNAIQFGRSFDLISISDSEQQLPKVYLQSDILLSANSSFTPSAITTINGQDVISFLEDLSLSNQLQDPDAQYNNLFAELAQSSAGQNGFTFSNPLRYPGPETTITHENGTTQTILNVAVVVGDFDGVDSGEKFYKKFCTPSTTTEAAASSSAAATATPTPEPRGPLYPFPVVKHSRNLVGGYFLNGTDIAVLSIPSFSADESFDDIQEFQDVVQKFLAKCQKKGKQGLVIDLQANPGGKILLAYDTFKQLFPTLEPWGTSNLRSHESMNIIGQQLSDFDGSIPQDNLTALTEADADEWYNYRASLKADDTPFKSWKQLYGPVGNSRGNFTNLLRYRNDWPVHTTLGQGIVITGYNNRSTGFTQPFAPENIIMVTDGFCASTCAIFSEFMKQQAGVQVIALGGRPFLGPMQAVGGVKGVEATEFSTIFQHAQEVISAGTKKQLAKWDATSSLLDLTEIPDLRSASGASPGLNLRNNIRFGDSSATPLHFVYEAADCRLFWTKDMALNITRVWEKSAQVAFKGQKDLCVQGSTGHPSSVSGGGANSTNVFGAGPRPVVGGGNGTVAGIRKMRGRRGRLMW